MNNKIGNNQKHKMCRELNNSNLVLLNPFHAIRLFLYPLKTENQRFTSNPKSLKIKTSPFAPNYSALLGSHCHCARPSSSLIINHRLTSAKTKCSH